MKKLKLQCSIYPWLLVLLIASVLIAACGSAETPIPIPTSTPAPEPTEVPFVIPEELADGSAIDILAIGDPYRGRDIFISGGGVIDHSPCITCHSLDGSQIHNSISMQGISSRAGERIEGLSAEEYLRESIVDPTAYIVEGPRSSMGTSWNILLSEVDINDLVAFLLTQ